MSDELVLAIDQGGQSTRAIAFDRQGQVYASHSVPVTTRRTGENHVEHDPDQLLSSVNEAIAAVAAETLGKRRIVAAGLATQRSTVVCWDRENGAALSPVISWQDRRAIEILRRFAPSEKVVQQITGLVRSPHYGASKLRWCLDNIDSVARARQAGTLAMGPLSSFLLFHLVSDQPFLADPVNASRTLLWDVNTLDWSDEMLGAFGIPGECLPTCVSSKHGFGILRGVEIPLTVCTGDQGAAIFAGGAVRAGTAYINIGTGAFVLAPVAQAPANTRLLRSVVWDDESTVMRVMEGTVNGAGSAVAARQASPADVVRAASAIATPGIPLFLNGESGLGSPYWREDFASRFVGKGDDHSCLTAVLESVLFLLQVNLEQIAWATNLRTIVVSGGLSHNDGLCQGLADLSGLVVRRPDEAEATARGLAFLTARLPTEWQPAPEQAFEPGADRNILRQRFSLWLDEMNTTVEPSRYNERQ
ncbi:MAG: FGGY family carbohydrate kinase [Gammaproteobacteria bacterium]|nr:FGGY family carbohydrate kinase [Gammaproteobacteria bacterium]MDH3768522.1 FGGY family carbohydrate kinase [Gammaproteobacteria bacterium]